MTKSPKGTADSGVSKTAFKQNRTSRVWGFTPQTEKLNGRLAMIGFVAIVLIEVSSGQGLLHFWNLL